MTTGIAPDSQLDDALAGHNLHCPKCAAHLTSLGLCPTCGVRYAFDQVVTWIDCDEQLPKKVGYYLVWIPAWEGYCNEDAFDIAWWNGSEWGELNAFAAIADGAPVTHWSTVAPPNTACSRTCPAAPIEQKS